MGFHKIEEMDFYEILRLDRGAAPEEIEDAYRNAIDDYGPESLASYGLISDEERRLMQERIADAYRTLRDPDRRRAYDDMISPPGAPASPRADFRRTVHKVEIQDADERQRLLDRIRNFFRPKKKDIDLF